jgi:hypothetical protein
VEVTIRIIKKIKQVINLAKKSGETIKIFISKQLSEM